MLMVIFSLLSTSAITPPSSNHPSTIPRDGNRQATGDALTCVCMAALGELIEIDDRTVLVLGQELDVSHDQPDAANALVHRVGDTLVIVDTGVTTAFRTAL